MKKKIFEKKVFNVLANNVNENDPMFNVTYFVGNDSDVTIGCVALSSTNRFDCREIHITMWGGGYHNILPLDDEYVCGCQCTPSTSEDLYDTLRQLPHKFLELDNEEATTAFAVTDYTNGELKQDQMAYVELAERILAQIEDYREDDEAVPSRIYLAARLMELHDQMRMSFDRFCDAVMVAFTLVSALSNDEEK